MQNISTIWADAGGFTRVTLLHLTNAATLASAVAAIKLGANADWHTYWGNVVTSQAGAPSSASFPSGRDEADLLFQDGSGGQTIAVVPAPKAGLFLADGETVNPADPTGVIAALLPILTTVSGNAVTSFRGGLRSRRT